MPSRSASQRKAPVEVKVTRKAAPRNLAESSRSKPVALAKVPVKAPAKVAKVPAFLPLPKAKAPKTQTDAAKAAEQHFTKTNVIIPTKVAPPKVIHQALPYTAESTAAIFLHYRPNNEMRFKAVITPDMAEVLLKLNVLNRPLSEELATFYARGLTDREWVDNGDAIRFSNTGALLDGQHRLRACIIAQLPIEVDIVLGLDPQSQATMDGGRRRTVKDNLAMYGVKYAFTTAAVMRYLFLLVEDSKNYRSSTPETRRILERYPRIVESVAYVCRGQSLPGISYPILATIHFLVTEFLGKQDRADAFVKVFKTGIPDYKGDKDEPDPAHRLREKLIMMRSSGSRITSNRMPDYMVMAYNYFEDRRSPVRLDPKENMKLKNLDPSLVDLS